MPKYVVLYGNKRKGDLPPDLLKSHINHLRILHSQGVLQLCGPLKNSGGKALLIFEAGSGREVEGYVSQDPFIVQAWYASYRVYEWMEVNVGNSLPMD